MISVTTDKSMPIKTDKDMADFKVVVVFMKATGATMAAYSMVERFTIMVTTTLVP